MSLITFAIQQNAAENKKLDWYRWYVRWYLTINNYLTKLNIVEKDRIVFNLPFEDSLRTLVKYQKQKETDLKYPRKYNEILKKEI